MAKKPMVNDIDLFSMESKSIEQRFKDGADLKEGVSGRLQIEDSPWEPHGAIPTVSPRC